ncbi:MAG TPA: hypothetical protein VMV27_14725 [Candidatus Binataceae bacterium]|nr:hypothetical protein [Candidatus Binataceae bacterium]
MPALVNREEVREENRRVLWAIIGVIIFLVMVSIVTILVKH